MASVRRVVIRDKQPVFDPEIFACTSNRVALLVAGISFIVQIAALAQVLMGRGSSWKWFDHAWFVVVPLIWLVLGFLVFLQRRASRAGALFLLLSAAGASYLSFDTLWHDNLVNAFIYSVGLLFAPPLLYSFTLSFLKERPWRRWEILLYLPPILLLWPTTQDFANQRSSLLWRAGIASIAIYLIAATVQALWDLRSARTPQEARQSRALAFGLVAGATPGVLIFVIPASISGRATLIPATWLPPIILLFLLAMSYSVLLFEFADVDLIVRRGVVYGAVTLGIVIAYAALGMTLAVNRASVTSPGGGLSFILVTVLVGAAFTPFTRAARLGVDWLLYGQHSDRWELLQALSARLGAVMQPEEVGEVLVRDIAEALRLRGAFLLRRDEAGSFVLRNVTDTVSVVPGPSRETICSVTLDGETIRRALGEPPATLLLVHARPLTAGRRREVPKRFRALDNLKVSLSIPLVTGSGLEAVLCLQPKLAHDAFDADDLELLAPVIRQATSALDNALLLARVESKVEELRHAYVRIANEQETERARLARELHDGTAQELANLITMTTVAERQLISTPGAVPTTLERMRQQAEAAYQGVRRASHALRPLMLEDFGLAPTLARYLQQFKEATRIDVDYMSDQVDSLPPDVELALFRVAQECMENVRKHSSASSAYVRLYRRKDHVVLTIQDTGHGMKGGGGQGIGLAGMRERIEAVGGDIHIESPPEKGVHVEAIIPLHDVTVENQPISVMLDRDSTVGLVQEQQRTHG